MDPFTVYGLSQAVPAIFSMFGDHPSAPSTNNMTAEQFRLMQPYIQQMMGSAFSPQSNILQHSLEANSQNLTNSFANRGMGQSSFLDAALMGSNAEILRGWQANEGNRQSQAVGAGMGMFQPANQMNTDAWNSYLNNVNQQNSRTNAFSNMAGGMAGAYGAKYMNDQNQNNFNRLNSYVPPTQGYGGGGGGYDLGVQFPNY